MIEADVLIIGAGPAGLAAAIKLKRENGNLKVLVLDNRVVPEAYGKTFARIWNMKHATANTVDDVKKFVS